MAFNQKTAMPKLGDFHGDLLQYSQPLLPWSPVGKAPIFVPPSLEKAGQPFHGLLQNLAVGRITDTDRSFPSCSKGHSRSQPDPSFFQQFLAEEKRICQSLNLWEQVERTVGRRNVTPGI
jgi:hypothetical protein